MLILSAIANLCSRGVSTRTKQYILLLLVVVNDCCGHLVLTYPPARKYPLDFLDNYRTQGPCGMPKESGLVSYTEIPAGSQQDIQWHVAYPHRGGVYVELRASNDTVLKRYPDSGVTLADDVTRLNYQIQLPSYDCEGCYLRMVKSAEEWGPNYIFWSCADVNVVSIPLNTRERCSNHGQYDGSKCVCDKLYDGDLCQFKNECAMDSDCSNHGKCVDTQSTRYPKLQCYCSAGWYGRQCEKESPVKSKSEIILANYKHRELTTGYDVYHRILQDTQEVEVVMQAETSTWVALGWRSSKAGASCQRFPVESDVQVVPEYEPKPEGEHTGTSDPEPEGEHTIIEPNPEGEHPAGEPHPEGEHTISEPNPEGEHTISEPNPEGEHTISEPNPEGEHPAGEPHPEGEHTISEPQPEGEHAISEPEPEPEPNPCDGSCNATSGCMHDVMWTHDPATQTITFTVKAQLQNGEYFGLGFSLDQLMPYSDIVVGWVRADGTTYLSDRWATRRSKPANDNSNDLSLISGENVNGLTTVTFSRPLDTLDTSDLPLNVSECIYLLTAKGSQSGDDVFSHHQVRDISAQKYCFTGCPAEPTPEAESVAENAPAAESSPGAETSPEGEKSPAAETSPEGEKSPAAETSPEGESSPGAETSPEGEKSPAAETSPEGEKSPAAETSPEGESSPGAETLPEGEKSPAAETSPEGESSPGAETSPEGEKSPGAETSPEGEKSPGAETSPEGEKSPAAETSPEGEKLPAAETSPEGEKSPAAETSPEGETSPETESESSPEAETTTSSHPMDCIDVVVGGAKGDLSRIGDYYTRDRSTPLFDEEYGGEDSLTAALGYEENGLTTILFRRKLKTNDPADWEITNSLMHVAWARGQEKNNVYHNPQSAIEKNEVSDKDYYKPDELKYHGTAKDQRGSTSFNFFEEPMTDGPETDCNTGGCTDPNSCPYTLTWTYDPSDKWVTFKITANLIATQWVALGISEDNFMPATDVIVAYFTEDGSPRVSDRYVTSRSPPQPDSVSNVELISGTRENSLATFIFKRRADTGDANDVSLYGKPGMCPYLFYGLGGSVDSSGGMSKHPITPYQAGRICFGDCAGNGGQNGEDSEATVVVPSSLRFTELTYSADYQDLSSAPARELKMQIEDGLNSVLTNKITRFQYKRVVVTGFRAGSVIADFDVEVGAMATDQQTVKDEVEAALQDTVDTGTVNNMKLDSAYLEVSEPRLATDDGDNATEEPEPECHGDDCKAEPEPECHGDDCKAEPEPECHGDDCKAEPEPECHDDDCKAEPEAETDCKTGGCTKDSSDCPYTLTWAYDSSDDSVTFNISTQLVVNEWVALGISEDNFMPKTDVIVLYFTSDGTATISDRYATGWSEPNPDSMSNVELISGTLEDGVAVFVFKRRADTGDEKDVSLHGKDGKCPYLFYGRGGNVDNAGRMAQHLNKPTRPGRVCFGDCSDKGTEDSEDTEVTLIVPSSVRFTMIDYQEEYKNLDSKSAKAIKKQIEEGLNSVLPKKIKFEYKRAVVTGLREGSVIADFNVEVDAMESDKATVKNEVEAALQDIVNNGTLNDMTLDTAYLQVAEPRIAEDETDDDDDDDDALGIAEIIIIAVAVAFVFVAVCVVLYKVWEIKQAKSSDKKRLSNSQSSSGSYNGHSSMTTSYNDMQAGKKQYQRKPETNSYLHEPHYQQAYDNPGYETPHNQKVTTYIP